MTVQESQERARESVVQFPRRAATCEEIVEGLRKNDPAAAAALYDRFADKVNGKVWRLLGADADHDDVVHQVFLHILTGIHKLKNSSSLEEWINGIAVNTVRREIRSRKYRRILVPMATPPEVVAPTGEPDANLFAVRFFAALRELRADDYVIFVLRFVEGSSLGEVAAAGGYSLSTAKRRLGRARKEFLKRAAKDPVLKSFIEEMNHD
ncbi:MAG: sigma-70 family RNA polymerase sigma factor [Proteobacteria bacterium]|jgi:RNA polymerase sigma-70 factor (ECF subfamily)|nr:sigma-70 family RNA polymerase sigma factor [Pseudomonadota bacterium]